MSILSKIPVVASTAFQVVAGPKVIPLTEEQRLRIESVMPRLDRLATLLDARFTIPIVGWKIGLDPLIGLIPYGDFVTGGVSLYILVEAVRMGAPPALLVRIIGRSAADLLLGLIPIIGDILDFFLKSHRGNVRDLHRWLEKSLAQPPIAAAETVAASAPA